MRKKKSGAEQHPENEPLRELVIPYIKKLTAEADDPDLIMTRVDNMTELLDSDPELKKIVFPTRQMFAVINGILEDENDDTAKEQPLEDWLIAHSEAIIQKLANEELIERFIGILFRAFQRIETFDERCSIVAAGEYMRMYEMDLRNSSFTGNPFWTYVFWKSAGNLAGKLDEFEEALAKEQKAGKEKSLGSPGPTEKSTDTEESALISEPIQVFRDGVELGNLTRRLPFHWIVRIPFTIDLLLNNPEIADDEEQPDPTVICAEVFGVAAMEGAENGVIDELLAICAKVLGESPSTGERITYSALETILESSSSEDCPILPEIYYELYMHYLTEGSDVHRDEIAEIFSNPRTPAGYWAYAEVLEADNDKVGASRAALVAKEIETWLEK